MKTFFIFLIFLISIQDNYSQDTMYIHQNGGSLLKLEINKIDSITFRYTKIVTDTTILKDIDGNVYSKVKIGQQTWMAENLKTTKLNDGTAIPLLDVDSNWYSTSLPAYCWFNNDKISYSNTFGALYNWYTVNTGKLCPLGWHVPTDNDWSILEIYLQNSGYNYDGSTDTDNDRSTNNKIAKSLASIQNWTTSSIPGAVGNTDYILYRNKSSFNAIPAGLRSSMGVFGYNNSSTYLWSSSAYNAYAWGRYLYFGNVNLVRDYYDKLRGMSVRCMKD